MSDFHPYGELLKSLEITNSFSRTVVTAAHLDACEAIFKYAASAPADLVKTATKTACDFLKQLAKGENPAELTFRVRAARMLLEYPERIS